MPKSILLMAALLRHHLHHVLRHTVAPAAMRVGPIVHHWTAAQANALALAVLGAVVVAVLLFRRSRRRHSN